MIDNYQAQWFDPVTNKYQPAQFEQREGYIQLSGKFENDMLLVLKEL
jgi:hypothetical protein